MRMTVQSFWDTVVSLLNDHSKHPAKNCLTTVFWKLAAVTPIGEGSAVKGTVVSLLNDHQSSLKCRAVLCQRMLFWNTLQIHNWVCQLLHFTSHQPCSVTSGQTDEANDWANRLAGKATITRGWRLGSNEVLRSLRHHLGSQLTNPKHHTSDCLKVRGTKKRGCAWRSALKGQEWGHHQSDKHWNCFKGNVGKTSERQDGAHIWGFSKHIATSLKWTALNYDLTITVIIIYMEIWHFSGQRT